MFLKRPRDEGFFGTDQPFDELTNYWVLCTKITYEGKEYPTPEHLYQARKFIYPGAPAVNEKHAEAIRVASTSCKAKVLASAPTRKTRSAKGLAINPQWDEIKLQVMREVIELKFRANPYCHWTLMSTHPFDLEERPPSDSFWGVGADGSGKNHLGKLLVELREKLRKERKLDESE